MTAPAPPRRGGLAALQLLVAAVWCGALWTVGYIVAPGLFAWAPDRTLAGMLAGRFFGVVGWLGLGAGLLLIGLAGARRCLRSRFAACAAAMWLCASALTFWIQPQAAQARTLTSTQDRGNAAIAGIPVNAAFARWHAVSSGVYLIQSLLGIALLLSWQRQA